MLGVAAWVGLSKGKGDITGAFITGAVITGGVMMGVFTTKGGLRGRGRLGPGAFLTGGGITGPGADIAGLGDCCFC